MSDYDTALGSAKDSELQEFLMIEKQKAQVNAQVCYQIKRSKFGKQNFIL